VGCRVRGKSSGVKCGEFREGENCRVTCKVRGTVNVVA